MELYVLLRNEPQVSSHATHHTTSPQCKCWLHDIVLDLWFLWTLRWHIPATAYFSFLSCLVRQLFVLMQIYNIIITWPTKRMVGQLSMSEKGTMTAMKKSLSYTILCKNVTKHTDRLSSSRRSGIPRSTQMIRLLQFSSQTNSFLICSFSPSSVLSGNFEPAFVVKQPWMLY